MSAVEKEPTREDWLDDLHLALEAEEDENEDEKEKGRARLNELLADIEPAEFARVLEGYPQNTRLRLLNAAAHAELADVLLHMSHDAAARLADEIGVEALVESASDLDATELAELVDAVGDRIASDLLGQLDIVRRRGVEEVLSYPEGTTGRVMHRDVITVRADTTVAVVLRYLKRRGQLPDNTDQLMVVGRDGQFRGTIGLLDLYSFQPGALVEEVMAEDTPRVEPEVDQQELIRLFLARDLLSIPVVARDGAMIGRVVASDIMDLLQDRAEHAMLARAGLDQDEDLFAPLLPAARNRAVWLGINLATAFLASWVISRFDATLEQIVALAVLMPVVASMGGIAGSQTLVLTIRGLALDQIAPSNRWWLLRKEVGISLLNGLLWSLVVAVVAWLWFSSVSLGVVIAVALVINMVTAAVSGLLIPLILSWLKFDPALSGSVVLTTITDVVGFLSFLGLATIFLL